jgi:adenylate kinase family enzyme
MPASQALGQPLRRIAVLGMAGAGKSTFAVALGEAIGAPVVHLDTLYWQPGWVAASWEEFRTRHDAIVAGERWVLDGNYASGGRAERLARADAVVVLLVPRRVAVTRVLQRTLRHRGQTRPDLGEGLPERFSLAFLRWVWRWHTHHPGFVDTVRAEAGDTPVHVLRTPAEAQRFLDGARRSLWSAP